MKTMAKYKINEGESKVVNGRKVYRIYATKSFRLANGVKVNKFERGGWIESGNNLAQDGKCWVSGNAIVFGNASVFGNAVINGAAKVLDNAQVSGNVRVLELAMVGGNSVLSGNEIIYGDTRVSA